jgi:hypothetical protein
MIRSDGQITVETEHIYDGKKTEEVIKTADVKVKKTGD